MKRTIVVIGATRVARHLLELNRFTVRALTRDPHSDAAQQLRDRGAEVVKGDLGDRASLRAAVKGAYGVFGVATRPEYGRNLVNAAAGADVEQLVFGAHVDGEALEQYAQSLGVPVSFIRDAGDDLGARAAEAFSL